MTALIKRRFEELKSYLGRDTEGIERLKLLKDAVNVLRKKAAASAEKAEAAEASRLDSHYRREDAEALLRASQSECRLLAERVVKLERDAKPPPERIVQPPADPAGTVLSVVKRLRAENKYCPRQVAFPETSLEKMPVFDRESISDGWTHADLWRLGSTVAIVAAMMGGVLITTDERLKDIVDSGDGAGVGGHVTRWFRKNMDLRNDAEGNLFAASEIQQRTHY
jgi:hypothetical protein